MMYVSKSPDYIKVAEAFLQNLLFFMFLQSSNPLSFAFGYHNFHSYAHFPVWIVQLIALQ